MAKSSNRDSSLIVRMPTVSRSGTPEPPAAQMGGRAMVAIFDPSQITSTPKGNSMEASKAAKGQKRKARQVRKSRSRPL